MKKKIIIFVLIFTSPFFGMELTENKESEPTLLPTLIMHAVKNNNKNNDLQNLLKQFEKSKSIITRKQNSSFGEVLKIADQNLENTKKQLNWWKNTSRMGQAGTGIAEILFGVSKAGYDLFQFSLGDTDVVANIFDVLADGILIRAGYYDIKLAIQNTSANSEYLKAEMIKFMIATTAENLKKSCEEEVESLEKLEEN